MYLHVLQPVGLERRQIGHWRRGLINTRSCGQPQVGHRTAEAVLAEGLAGFLGSEGIGEERPDTRPIPWTFCGHGGRRRGEMVEGSGVPEVEVHFEARSRRSRFSGTVSGDALQYAKNGPRVRCAAACGWSLYSAKHGGRSIKTSETSSSSWQRIFGMQWSKNNHVKGRTKIKKSRRTNPSRSDREL